MSAAAGSGLEPGAEFAGHEIEGELGRGGMGIVYRARNLALDRIRALKVLAPELSADARFRERFRRESRLAASIEHPNVIPVHDAGEEEGRLYIAMRLVEGRDLRREIGDEGPLELGRLAAITRAVAAALDAAHDAGLVHRDVKPANVLVGGGDDERHVYLTDFGISRSAAGGGETMTKEGELLGTADFVSPEQVKGDPVDRRSDVYALGAVVHYAATGQSPFPRDSELAVLFAHANAARPRPSAIVAGLPPAVDAVVARAMAIDPEHRYETAGALAAALAGAIEGGDTTPLEAPRGEPERGWRPSGALVLGGVLGLAAAAVALALLLPGDNPAEETNGQGPTTSVTAPPVQVLPPIDVGAGPSGLTVGELRVWVAASAGDEVDGIDLVTKELERIRLDAPASVAVGFGSIWAVSRTADALYRLDPAEGTGPVAIPLGPDAEPVDVAVDENWVWVAERGTGMLARVDPADPEAAPEEVRLGTAPRALATGGGDVWVALGDDASVVRVDAGNARRTTSPIGVDELPTDIAYGEGGVWVISNLRGTVTEIDPERGETVGDPVSVGDLPRGVKAGLDYVWVALGGEDAVVRVDPANREPAGGPIVVGANPSDLALGPESVWVANEDDATVTRIDP